MRALTLLLAALCACVIAACQPPTKAGMKDVLLIGNSAEPLTLDPLKASGTWENHIIGDMFMGLTTEDAASEVAPGMATSWSVSQDGLTWTFQLRDAVWSDGAPVTADDFVAAFRRLMDPNTLSEYASIQFGMKNAEAVYEQKLPPEALGVRAIDPKTLEITLENPEPYLPQLLKHYTAFPIPQHVVAKVGGDWIKPKNIVVNGAYKLVRWRTNDLIEVVKNERFWDAENVCFKRIFYYPTNDPLAAERRVRAGQLDVNTEIDGTRLKFLKRNLPGYARVADFMGVIFVTFNTRKKPFDDPRVRRALSLAINRDFIADEILRAGQRPAYSLIPPHVANYPGSTPLAWASEGMQQRRAEARALLQAAGFGPDNPLTFTYSHRNTADNPRIAPVLQKNWNDIAPWVRVQIQGVETQIHYSNLRTGDYDVGDGGWIADFNDARNFLFLMETKSRDQNYSKYSNPEFDRMLAQSDSERDLIKRGKLLAAAEQITARDQPMAPIVYYVNKNLVRPDVSGWVDNIEDIHRSRYLCRKSDQSPKL